MKDYILYTEDECEACKEFKKTLNENNITFINKDLNKGEGWDKHKYRFEKNDLTVENNLPGYVPILVVKEANKKHIFASGHNYEEREGVTIFDELTEIINQIK